MKQTLDPVLPGLSAAFEEGEWSFEAPADRITVGQAAYGWHTPIRRGRACSCPRGRQAGANRLCGGAEAFLQLQLAHQRGQFGADHDGDIQAKVARFRRAAAAVHEASRELREGRAAAVQPARDPASMNLGGG